MTHTQSRARFALAMVALLAVALLAAACVGGGPAPAATQAPAQTAAPGASTQAPAQATQPAAGGDRPELPAGVDADGNFYLGDPNAAVKLEEWSDFQ